MANARAEAEKAFPPPPSDFAAAEITRREISPALAEIIAPAVLDEIDALLNEASVNHAVSRILKSLGTNKRTAVDEFAERERNKESAAGIIEEMTGVPEEKILSFCPEIGEVSAGDPEKIRSLTRQAVRAIVSEDIISRRDLSIESLTRILCGNHEDYVTREAEVTKHFDKLLEEVCAPDAPHILAYAGARTGKALLTAGKYTGIFLFRSAITQNLPASIKEKLRIEDEVNPDGLGIATGITSMVISGTAEACLIASLFPGPLTAGGILACVLMGSVVEFAARMLIATSRSGNGRPDIIPGCIALEVAKIPVALAIGAFRLAGNAVNRIRESFTDYGKKVRETKRKELEDKGLL